MKFKNAKRIISLLVLPAVFAFVIGCSHSDKNETTEGSKVTVTQTDEAKETTGLTTGNESGDEPMPIDKTPIQNYTLRNDNGSFSVFFCKDGLVHFKFAPSGEEFLPDGAIPEAVTKYDSDYDTVYGKITEEQNEVLIETERLSLKINKNTFAFSILSDGKAVFKSTDDPFIYKDEGKRVSFKRDVASPEHFYGLGNDVGDDFKTTDHRDSEYSLWLNDNNVHAIIPLYYSTSGYGIYVNNSNKGKISFKSDYFIYLEGGEMNFYFIYGPSFKDILTDWSELAGRMNMPPLYALGLTYRGFGQFNETQLENKIADQLEEGISIDVAGVEPGWQTATYPCSYDWNPNFTKDAKAFVDRMHSYGLHVNLWEHPYVSPKSAIYSEIKKYSLRSEEIGTRAWEGNSGKYAFGGIVPDLTIKEARESYWKVQNKNLISLGVDGFKVDETDSWGSSNSLSVLFPSGISNNAYHNLLGTLTVNLLHEKYRSEYGKRSFIFSRGNYFGMQKYATSAYTDYYGFDQFVMSVVVQSYSGTYYTPEIRDVSTPNDISYMRRAQLMFLTPFSMSNEWATDASVLSRSRSVIECYKRYNKLHYRLIPYMYSFFYNQNKTGIGVTRSLLMEFENDPKTMKIDNEFMLGDSLLVAPVSSLERIAKSNIYLPAGESFMDYNTGYIYKGGQTIEYMSSASVLPLFVRMGAIIPMADYGKNTSDLLSTDLTVDLYPSEKKTNFELYEDDGISYEYENGNYALSKMSLVKDENGIHFTIGEREGKYSVPERNCILTIHYRSNPESVTIDGKEMKKAGSKDELYSSVNSYFYDEDAENDFEKIIYVIFKDDSKAHEITVKAGEENDQEKPVVLTDGTVYECEDHANVFGGTKTVTGKKNASGEAVVTNIGGKEYNTLTIKNIKVAKDGIYDVEIIYLGDKNDKRTLGVKVNVGEVIPVSCMGSKYTDSYLSLSLSLSLKQGDNEITLSGEDGEKYFHDVDCIIVYDKETVDLSMKGTIYSIEDAVIEGGITVSDASGAQGGKAVFGMGGYKGASVTYKVSVEKAGPYQLNFNCAALNENERIKMAVNGAESEIIIPCTKSSYIFTRLNMTVYLEKGENTISFYNDESLLKYECEVGGEYVNCNNKLATRDGYPESGGYAVGATASNGSASFTMKGITVPEDGEYRVIIYVGSGDTRTFRLKVNGVDTGTLYSASTGHFHNFKPYEFKLNLKKGENTLTIWQKSSDNGDSQWLPNFDYIVLPELSSESKNSTYSIGSISIQ